MATLSSKCLTTWTRAMIRGMKGGQASRLEMLNGEAVEMAVCVDTALMFTFYDHTPKARIYNVKRTFRVVTA